MKAREQQWIILDRDGVINHDSDAFIKTPEEWLLIKGSDTAIAKLNRCGYKIAVITNQSGLGRGYLTRTTLQHIHQKMRDIVAQAGGHIAAIYHCPHAPSDNCACRKPLDGMFRQFAQAHAVDLSSCYALGDSIRDLEAARSSGCTAVLLKTGKGNNSLAAITQKPAKHWLKSVPVYDDLKAFTDTFAA